MAFVGLDFGTTTSILSYLDGGKLRPFHYGGQTDGTPYIPSVVAYLQEDLRIGNDAVQMRRNDARLYRYFKMLLPQEDKEKWLADFGPYETEARDPSQVAADFIGELICGSSPGRERLSINKRNLEAFQHAQGETIEGLIVSVPQVWSLDVSARGRQQLQTVVNELGLPLLQLISEPVAAAAYFAYRYMQRQKEPYQGNLLICDMGGGTFDVTLCKLGKDRVEVLCNAGNGERGLGIAGAHFDLNLLKLKLGEDVSPESLNEFLLILDREKKSKDNANRLMSYIQVSPQERVRPIYYLTPELLQPSVNIRFEEIEEAFEPVREGIFEVLNRVRLAAEQSGYPIDRVVMVGGFSKFPLVQEAVGRFFQEEDVFLDPKLIDLVTLNRDDMAFAISYGACLVANEKVKVTETYDHTIGIMVYPINSTEKVELELIRAGKSLDLLQQTKFCCMEDGRKRRFMIGGNSVEVEIVIRRLGSQAERNKFIKKLSLTDVPNSDADNHWFLGTRVDKSKIPYLVLRDERHGAEKDYALGDLIPPIIMED